MDQFVFSGQAAPKYLLSSVVSIIVSYRLSVPASSTFCMAIALANT